jgi:hypothetical protein
MTKKDYIKLADTIIKTVDNIKKDTYFTKEEKNNQIKGVIALINELTKTLKQDNPRFDAYRFEQYIFNRQA